jgi:hypothetical protein
MLAAGEHLEAEDRRSLLKLIKIVNRRALVGVWIWLGVLAIGLGIVQVLKVRYGIYDKGFSGVVVSIWILSIGIIRFLPDYGIAQVMRRLRCAHCGRSLWPKDVEKFIASEECPRCGHGFYGKPTKANKS